MADISSITQAASYRGDPNLGGSIDAPIIIDNTAIQRFATFQFYSSQAKWQQKQVDDATAAKQIAQVTAFDISSPLQPYSDALKGKLKDIQDYVRSNPNALVYSRDAGGFQELQNKINDFQGLRKSATASDAVYAANKTAIDTAPDLQTKSFLQSDLNTRVKELFDGGVDKAKDKILASASPLNPDDFKLPTVKLTTYDAISSAPNADYTTQLKFINLDQVDADSELTAAGLNKTPLDETTDAFKALSPERQELERQKSKLAFKQRLTFTNMANSFNSLLDEYKAAHPNEDISQIKGTPTGHDTLTDIIKSANSINDQIDQVNAFIAGGKYKDPTGKIITKQFKKINVADGLSDAELIKLNTLQAAGGAIFTALDKTISANDNALQASQQAETRRHNIAGEGLEGAALKLKQDEWKQKMSVGGETVKNSALERAKRIYEDLKKLTDANGVISPDKVRQLNAEQLKYLGTEVTENNTNTGISKTSFQPLDLSTKNEEGKQVSEYAIQLDNGQIKVLRPKEGEKKIIKTNDGVYVGLWDNSKSTNLFNVGTNILNEELQKAGSKELNSYTPIDLGNLNDTQSTNNTTKVTTSSSGATFDKTKLAPIVKNGVTYYVDPATRKVFDKEGKPLN